MALTISGYTDPGVIVGEVITPAAISISTVPDLLGIVAIGDRQKRAINEAVKRGQVSGEVATFAGSPPHTYTLTPNRGDRRVSNTTIRRTLAGLETVINSTFVSYPAAELTGTTTETFDVSTNNAIGIKLDAGQKVTMNFTDGASAVVITGTLIEVTTALATAGAAATAQEIADGINAGLAAASALGYGAAYAAVATVDALKIKITSPLSTPDSDVQVVPPFDLDATTALGFVTTVNDLAPTLVEIDATQYDASATYEMDYVAVDTTTDALAQTATAIHRVGSFANVTSFISPTDYLLTGGDIDWSPDTASTFTGSLTETFDLSTNKIIKIALDGKAAVEIDLVQAAPGPAPGWVDLVAGAATAAAADIATNINALLSVSAGYGPDYIAVASATAGLNVKLDSPVQGIASSIEFSAPSATDATTIIFGITTAQYPYTVIGTGSTPANGVIYFATYGYDRPSTEYDVPKRFFSEDAMIQDLGPVSTTNTLSMYGQIGFDNGAPSLFTCQVDDATSVNNPTVNEMKAGIDGLEQSSLITDVLTVDTRLNVQTHQTAHIENQSSPTEKNFRTGWYGMPIGTLIGDQDTPDTFVYRAGVTLQVPADSPGRGRLILVAPTGVDRTITLEDGSEVTLNLDSTATACAVAARHTSFTSPAISLASKNVVGFDATTFPTFVRAERAQLASNGTLIVTETGGRLSILDPVTTEVAGGNLPQFSYRSVTSQKDNVTRAVTRVVDTNLRGIVPEDLADFIFDIKTFIGQTLVALIESGAIGAFRDENGVSRDIDLSRDVQAEQSTTDPTKFFFRYFFFLRYPALRFFGEFSVDNPFFTT